MVTRTPGIEVNTGKPLGARCASDARRRVRQAGNTGGQRRFDPGGNIAASVPGLDSLPRGFGLDDDQVHSPNEKFEQRCFHHGIRSHTRLLAKFAGG